MKSGILGLIALATLIAATAAKADTWNIDGAHSAVKFVIKHLMISNVTGKISGMKGTFTLSKDGKLEAIDASVDPNTINTDEAKRDAHLKSADFFNVAKNPAMTFKSTEIKKDGDKYKIIGNLTMHGVTKPVTLTSDGLTPPITAMGATRRGFEAEGTINRKDWGLAWNKALETGGVVVGEDVKVTVDAEITAPKDGGDKKADKKEEKKEKKKS